MRKLVVLLAAGLLIGGTAQAAQASTYKVSISASRSTIELGQSLKISGHVSPHAKGKTVKIQRRLLGGSWKTIKSVKLNSHSNYSYSFTPTTGGPQDYRVEKARSGKVHTKISSTRTVNVWRWRSLLEIPRDQMFPVTYGTQVVAGQALPNSVALPANYATWVFASARCTIFKSQVGIADSSAATFNASPRFHWIRGATETEFQAPPRNDQLLYGQNPRSFVEPIPADASAFRIDATVGGMGAGTVVLGTPQLYCNS